MNQNSLFNIYQQWSISTVIISLQTSTDKDQLIQSTSENKNLNLYCEPYQNWAEQQYNQWNKDVYKFNYLQQFKVYYNKAAN